MLDELLLLSLNLFFFLLLPSHILPYLVFVETDSADAIPSCPEMSAPVAFADRLVLLEELEGELPLEVAHE